MYIYIHVYTNRLHDEIYEIAHNLITSGTCYQGSCESKG